MGENLDLPRIALFFYFARRSGRSLTTPASKVLLRTTQVLTA